MPLIPVGAAAPDFHLPRSDGGSFRLADHRGYQVVLWWFPKAASAVRPAGDDRPGPRRTTYLIGRAGAVAASFYVDDIAGHADEVARALAADDRGAGERTEEDS